MYKRFLWHDKSVDLTRVISCRSTLFECLRHNHLSLRQVPHHKPDLLLFRTIASLRLLFRTIAGAGDVLEQKLHRYPGDPKLTMTSQFPQKVTIDFSQI